jgi:SAM-dependent methyltransferase
MSDSIPSGNLYWNSFYRSEGIVKPSAPSQFAAFMIGELSEAERIVDIGCGNGRDALFFASMGRDVVGVDASSGAIDHCTAQAARSGLKVRFHCAPVGQPGLADVLAGGSSLPTLVYSRFFLHAIRDEDEAALLGLVADMGRSSPVRLAMEFRTHRDANLPKATATHFRRFVDPMALLGRVTSRGFTVDYFVEGFGFAKYKSDDAHVARIVLSR